MDERENFVQIGDYRDIPMTLGLIVMAWNACELSIHDLLRTLVAKGEISRYRVVEPLIVELGAVGLAHALLCFAHELPPEESQLAEAVRSAAEAWESARPYRNYYIHGISGVTRYGIDFSFDTMDRDVPLHEAITMGPFGKVYLKTAKGRNRFLMDFIALNPLAEFNNYLADFRDHLRSLRTSAMHYFKSKPLSERAAVPAPMPKLGPLQKPAFDHPRLKFPPALAADDPIEEVEDGAAGD